MDKPLSMPVKEYLLRIMSVRTNIPQKTIEAVIEHQFESIGQVMQKPGINSIEVSGFGKFLFNAKKSQKLWDKNLERQETYEKELENIELSDTKRNALKIKLDNTLLWFEKSKEKINEHKSNSRGLEKQAPPCSGYEDDDRRNLSEEN